MVATVKDVVELLKARPCSRGSECPEDEDESAFSGNSADETPVPKMSRQSILDYSVGADADAGAGAGADVYVGASISISLPSSSVTMQLSKMCISYFCLGDISVLNEK